MPLGVHLPVAVRDCTVSVLLVVVTELVAYCCELVWRAQCRAPSGRAARSGEFVGANVQVFDRNVAANPCAGCRWPEQVYISPLYSVPFSGLERRSEFEASRSAGFPLMGMASMADSAPPPPAPVTYYSSGGGGTGCTPGSSLNSDGTCKPYDRGDLLLLQD